jgi:hypothetical protein
MKSHIFYGNLQFNPLSIWGLASHSTCAAAQMKPTLYMRILIKVRTPGIKFAVQKLIRQKGTAGAYCERAPWRSGIFSLSPRSSVQGKFIKAIFCVWRRN